MPAHDALREPVELPIACSLDAAELGARQRRWTELVRTTGTGARAIADGVELRFQAGEATDRELQELVDGERECCPWARWELYRDGDRELVMLAHAGNDTGAATLQSMFLPNRA